MRSVLEREGEALDFFNSWDACPADSHSLLPTYQ